MPKTAALPPQPDEALGPKQTKTSAESDQSVDNDKTGSKYPVKPNQVEVSKTSDEPPSKQPEKAVEETVTENEQTQPGDTSDSSETKSEKTPAKALDQDTIYIDNDGTLHLRG
jgi:hypothetical protein